MPNFKRGPRNDLIRQLRERGWSMRRIARHPDVDLSVAMVHLILNPAVDDDDADVEVEPVIELTEGRRNLLELYRACYAEVPDPAATAAWEAYRARRIELCDSCHGSGTASRMTRSTMNGVPRFFPRRRKRRRPSSSSRVGSPTRDVMCQ